MKNLNFRVPNEISYTELLIRFLLVLCKFVFGIFGYSTAMLADAVYSLASFVTKIFYKLRKVLKIDGKEGIEELKNESIIIGLINFMLLGVGIAMFIINIQKSIRVYNGKGIILVEKWVLLTAFIMLVIQWIIGRKKRGVLEKQNINITPKNILGYWQDVFVSIITLLGIFGTIYLNWNWIFLDSLAGVITSIVLLKVVIQNILKELKIILRKKV